MDKLLNKIEKTPTCWNWTGTIRETNGYGRVEYGGRTQTAHRVVYEFMVGKIPDGFDLDHLCRNRKCVNPKHLEPVTRLENIRRYQPFRLLKTRCVNGHLYDKENTVTMFRQSRMKDFRICRTCKNKQQREYLKRKREKARSSLLTFINN